MTNLSFCLKKLLHNVETYVQYFLNKQETMMNMIASGKIMQDKTKYSHSDLTEIILGCCFDVMNELGIGFLESVYKNALFIALKEKGFAIEAEKRFEVIFRDR